MTDPLRDALLHVDAESHDPQAFLREVHRRVRRRRFQRLLPVGTAAVVLALVGVAAMLVGHRNHSDQVTKGPTAATALGNDPSSAAASPDKATKERQTHAPRLTAPIPTCQTLNLRATYRGGGLGTGNDFGSIVVWNTGPRPCALSGRVGFSAWLADGARDAAAGTEKTVTVAATLAPRTPQPTPGADLSQGSYLQALLTAPERDDPGQPDGLCRTRDKLTPKVLRLTIKAIALDVPNHDPHADGRLRSLYGCHGRMTLTGIEPPTIP